MAKILDNGIISGVIANLISATIVFILGIVFLNKKRVLSPWIYKFFGVRLAKCLQFVIRILIHPLLRVILLAYFLVILNFGQNHILYSLIVFLIAISFILKPKAYKFFDPSPNFSDGFETDLNKWVTKTGVPQIEENFGKPAPDLLLKSFSQQATNSFLIHKEIEADLGIIECDFYLESNAILNIVFFADPNLPDHRERTDNWYMARYDSRPEFSDGFLIKEDGPGVNWKDYKMSGTQTNIKIWHRARLEFDSTRVSMYKNGELVMQFDNPKQFGRSIGLFNELADVHIDNFTFTKK